MPHISIIISSIQLNFKQFITFIKNIKTRFNI